MTNLKIRKTLVALLFGMTAVLNSCVQEDWYELYDVDETPLSNIARRKRKNKDIILGGVEQSGPYSKTCFIAVAAYYKTDKSTSGNFLSNYYLIFDNLVVSYYNGHKPLNYSRSYEANYWFGEQNKSISNSKFPDFMSTYAGKSYTFVSSNNGNTFNMETLCTYIENHKASNNLVNNDYIIGGIAESGDHIAIYSGYSIIDGNYQIITTDPGFSTSQQMISVDGVFIPQ